ncbi:MAG: DUF1501 domain-containing protein [Verrucomicrobia bacterium]|nr:DUF1501 domain-containing protein [Verrucomicrobiota bacterium]
MTRRELLRAGALGLFGLTAADWVRARAGEAPAGGSFGRAKRCILLFMWGGPAHQDTWDLKPDAPSEVRGEFNSIATHVPGIRVCEHFPMLARRMDLLCQVRSMTHDNGDHTTATSYLLTGEPPVKTPDKRAEWPHMGAVLSSLWRGSGALPPFVSMRPKLENDVPRFVEQSQGQFAGWLGPLHDPLTIDADPSRPDYRIGELTLHPELSVRRLQERRDLASHLDRRLESLAPNFAAQDLNSRRAFELLTAAATERDAFNLGEESTKLRERYGLNPHGQSVLQARRLVERGVPLVTVFWPNDGTKNVSVYWDTHSRNFTDLKTRLMPVADRAFSALLDDLKSRGMLDDTLVIWTGEFGRTPRVGQRSSDAGAGRDGRDHWGGCFTSVLAGAGVKGGFVYGKSDKEAAFPAENPVAPRDLIATVYHLLGVPEQQMLLDNGGRPQFVRPGRAIAELLA